MGIVHKHILRTYLQLCDDGVVDVFLLLLEKVKAHRVQSIRPQLGITKEDLQDGMGYKGNMGYLRVLGL